MSDTLYPAGTRVIERRGYDVGTSNGTNQLQSLFYNCPLVSVEFDNGRRDAIPEDFLREATEEDEARSAERIRQAEESNRRAAERSERIRRDREEAERYRQQRKQEEAEAKEEARRQAEIKHTAEMREENARLFGLRSLKEA